MQQYALNNDNGNRLHFTQLSVSESLSCRLAFRAKIAFKFTLATWICNQIIWFVFYIQWNSSKFITFPRRIASRTVTLYRFGSDRILASFILSFEKASPLSVVHFHVLAIFYLLVYFVCSVFSRCTCSTTFSHFFVEAANLLQWLARACDENSFLSGAVCSLHAHIKKRQNKHAKSRNEKSKMRRRRRTGAENIHKENETANAII